MLGLNFLQEFGIVHSECKSCLCSIVLLYIFSYGIWVKFWTKKFNFIACYENLMSNSDEQLIDISISNV